MPELTQKQQEYLLQFQHPEKILSSFPGISEKLIAELFNLKESVFKGIRKNFSDAAETAAQELLIDEEFSHKIENLPFAENATIVALGDSITDDLQSWFEVLRHCCNIHIPDKRLNLVNLGISGDTTSQMIARFLEVVNAEPDWIFCFTGTNDARLHGLSPTKVLVSPEETEKNLEMLSSMGKNQTNAKWVWITPATVIEEKIASNWFLSSLQLMWRNTDLNLLTSIIKIRQEPVVDLQEVFGHPPSPELLLDDGLHPSLTGHKQIVKALLNFLSKT